MIVGGVAGGATGWTSGGVFILLWILSAALVGGALAHAQAGLNAYRRFRSGDEAPVHVRGWEWGILLFGGFLTLIALFNAFPEAEG